MTADRLGKEAHGCSLVPLLRQKKIDGLARLIHRTIQIAPLPADADVGLVQPPAEPDRTLAEVERLFELRCVLQDPAVDGRVVDRPSPRAPA
jgi:hypothetical protein